MTTGSFKLKSSSRLLVLVGLTVASMLYLVMLRRLPEMFNGYPVVFLTQDIYSFLTAGWGFFNVLTLICVIGFGGISYVYKRDPPMPEFQLGSMLGSMLGTVGFVAFDLVLMYVLRAEWYTWHNPWQTTAIFMLGGAFGAIAGALFGIVVGNTLGISITRLWYLFRYRYRKGDA